MTHRLQLLCSLFIGLLCTSCRLPVEKAIRLYNADSLVLENRNGIMYSNQNPFTGRVYQLYPNQDTLQIFGFYEGREDGAWKRFFPNGQIQELRYFDKGTKVKTLTRWWENGQMQLKCTFVDGAYQGALKSWNSNGQLIEEMHYKNGYEEGSQKMYYDNGKIRSNYVVKNGKRIGLLGTKNCVNVSDSIFKK